MRKNENKKLNTVKNNLYLLKMVQAVSPSRIWLCITTNIFTSISNILIPTLAEML